MEEFPQDLPLKDPTEGGIKLLEFLTLPSIAQGKLSRESQGD